MSFAAINREALNQFNGAVRTVLALLLTECRDRDNPDYILEGKPFPLKRGQWIGSIKTISDKTGLSQQEVRTALDKLRGQKEPSTRLLTSTATIISTSTATSRATLYTIDLIDEFMGCGNQPTSTSTSTATSTATRSSTTNKQNKQEEKKVDPPKGVSTKESQAPDFFDFDRAIENWNLHTGCKVNPKNSRETRRRGIANTIPRLIEHYGLQPDQSWEALCRYIPTSDLLSGRKNAWKADIDWVLKPANLTKVLEGKYDDNNPQQTTGKTPTQLRLEEIAARYGVMQESPQNQLDGTPALGGAGVPQHPQITSGNADLSVIDDF